MPYKRASKWVGCVMRSGAKRYQTFLTRKEAVAWEAEQKRRPLSDFLARIRMEYFLGEWAVDYLDYCQRFAQKTYKEKQSVFRLFFKMFDKFMPFQSFNQSQALKFLDRQFKTRGGNAANKDRKNLMAGWEWGITFREMPRLNPFKVIPKYGEKRIPRYVLPESSFWKAYDGAQGKDRVMLLAFLHLAARRTEIFRLRWDDVDFAGLRVRLWTRKRKDGSLEADWLPMTDDLFTALLNHQEGSESEWVFPNPETGSPYADRKRWLESVCRKAGVRPFGFHSIRHLSASILARAGAPAIMIQAILRHKNLSTTERYLHQLMDLRPVLVKALTKKKCLQNCLQTEKPAEAGLQVVK